MTYKEDLLQLLQAVENYLRLGPSGFEEQLELAVSAARESLTEDAPACDCGRSCVLTFSEGACWECPVCR